MTTQALSRRAPPLKQCIRVRSAPPARPEDAAWVAGYVRHWGAGPAPASSPAAAALAGLAGALAEALTNGRRQITISDCEEGRAMALATLALCLEGVAQLAEERCGRAVAAALARRWAATLRSAASAG